MQNDYQKSHSWQYDIRLKRQAARQDLGLFLTEEVVKTLTVKDFKFEYIPKEDKKKCAEVKKFIETYEWLGSMPLMATHRFIVTYEGIIGGAVVMANPNSYNFLTGKGLENRKLEKLIARGACAWWTPKHLASHLIMESIKWMVQNTKRRVFTAYGDTEAKELGTIYQACNFIYLGKSHGGSKMYLDPNDPKQKWHSERNFRSRSAYKRYARQLGIAWQTEWLDKSQKAMSWENEEEQKTVEANPNAKRQENKIAWDKIPPDIITQLKNQAKIEKAKCISRETPPKHKYCYILGRDKRETKLLKEQFAKTHPKLVNLPYPKERGV